MIRAAVIVLMMALAIGCSDREEAPAPAETEVASPSEEPPVVEADPAGLAYVMRDHADRIDQARRAVIRGDLDGIRAPLRWLATHPSKDALPESWRPKLEAMQRQARATSAAEDLPRAAHGLAQLTVTCSGCHAELNRGPGVPVDSPPGGEDLREHMQRHDWAMERMWEGLVAGAGPMYQRGALALVEAPLHGDDDPDEEYPLGVTALANRVHDIGLEAHDSADLASQVRLYGELLETCAGCHQLVEADLSR